MKCALLVVVLAAAAALLGAADGATEKRQLRIGLVEESNVLASRDVGRTAFMRALDRVGAQGRVVFIAPNHDATQALVYLARQRYDLIIARYFDHNRPAAIEPVAREFPGVKFLLPDESAANLERLSGNIEGSVFRAQEAAYLAGYLAAMMEHRRPGKDMISWVGGRKNPGVDRWAAGYEAGARRADPDITILHVYTNDFVVASRCKTAALSQIARGAGVVFNIAGGCGLGALQAAKEKGVWGIGVDGDQSYLGPHVLTSAVVRIDAGILNAMRALEQGTFRTGGNRIYGLREGGVGLGKVSTRVPRSVLRQVERIRRQIVAGKIRVPSTI